MGEFMSEDIAREIFASTKYQATEGDIKKLSDNQYLRQNEETKQDAEHDTEMRQGSYTPCRIWIPQSHPTPGATAHAGYYGLFSLFTPVSGLYHARSPEPGDRSHVGDDRPRDDAGARAMGRHRGELSDDPTVLYDQYQLGHTPM